MKRFIAALLALLLPAAALAQAPKPAPPGAAAQPQKPSFPAASRIGMTPMKGMVLAGTFTGFEDKKTEAAVFFTELSIESFEGASSSLAADQLTQQGIKLIRRDDPKPGGPKRLVIRAEQTVNGKAVERWFVIDGTGGITALAALQFPKAQAKAYPEKAVRAALATIAVRGKLSDEEMLSALPFHLRDLAGFRLVRVMAGATAILTDGEKDAPEPHEQPVVIVTRSPAAPPPEAEREEFARRVFGSTRAAGSLVTERSGPVTLDGAPGHEIAAAGRDTESKQDLFAMQSFRFGENSVTRILAVGPARDREALEKRFTALRGGVAEKAGQ